MNRSLPKFTQKTYDVLIIGGGITGACLAWDAVNRGLTVGLVEKNDFGAATSSASSKLIHGGIRYIQQGRIDKIRESALERIYYQKIAPHLSNYIAFVVPSYRGWLKSKLVLGIGMFLYQLVCLGQNSRLKDTCKKVPGWKMLTKNQVEDYVHGIELDGITGGAIFYESHMQSSERMTLAFIMSAANNGASVANYVRTDSFIRNENKVKGVCVTDLLTGKNHEIYAKCVINAAGPWIPLLNKELSTKKIVTAFSKGAHIVTSQITIDAAIALTTKKKNQGFINRGGRHIFIIPWRNHSLIGTTYDAYEGELDRVRPTEQDIEELISDINAASGCNVLDRSQVKYSFAGIYPLIDNKINTKVYQGTGEYQIVDHAESDGLDGVVTVFGAKYTTARLLAEKALNKIQRKFSRSISKCKTRTLALPCGDIDNISNFREAKKNQYAELLNKNVIEHLVTYYGKDIDDLIAYVQRDPDWGKLLSADYPDIEAQIIYAIEHEMAYHLDDILFRRTGLGTLGNPGMDVIERCADIMSQTLQWDAETRQSEIDHVLSYYHYED